MKLFMIRHGETVANASKFYSGQSDVLLTERGRSQAAAINPILSRFSFDRVYSSDLTRAMDTQALALPEYSAQTTPLLREFSVGTLTCLPFSEVNEKLRSMLTEDRGRGYLRFGGESTEMVCARVRNFLEMLEADPCDHVAAFTHNGVLGCAMQVILNAEFDRSLIASPNCAIHVFEYKDHKWYLRAWNYMGDV